MRTLFPLSSWARRWALVAGCLLGAVTVQAAGAAGSPAGTTAPANDDCANAIALTPGASCVPVSGTTVAATQSLPGTTNNPSGGINCGGLLGYADDDVWYKFVATATSHAIIVVPTMVTFDPIIDVRSGACPGLNIACADDSGPADPEFVNATGLTVGQTYYLRIYSLGNGPAAMGTFTVCVANSPTCFSPTNLAVSNISSNSAKVSFTIPAGGATGYTLTYTPAGGAPQTQAVTSSPFMLTGLTPGKAYTISLVSTCGTQASAATTTSFSTPLALAARPALADGQVVVFPNPAHASFTVSLPALGSARTAELELLNALGQRVRQQTQALAPGGTQAVVDAAALPAGIYLLRVQVGDESAVSRLIIN